MTKFNLQKLSMSVSAVSIALGAIAISSQSAQAFTITPTNDSNTLVNTILGSGINVVPGSINLLSANGASGTFTNGLASGIGIDSGIILTTGSALNALGPNISSSSSLDNSTPGDADLSALISASTYDAVVLEFDFESTGGDIFFNYVFASEEYNEYVNTVFNDVFAFFLDGVNIALIPGTTTPVSINNVNGGTNSQFFNNNDINDGGPFFDIEYDGFTTVFTAKALGLSAGTHKMKLAIADGGDGLFDSAVFIQASSFSDTNPDPVSTPEPASLLGLLAVGAFGANAAAKRKKAVS